MKNKILIYFIILVFIPLTFCSKKISIKDKLMGLWLIEIKSSRSVFHGIYLFQEINSTKYNGRLLGLDNMGSFINDSFKLSDKKILFENSTEPDSISFDGMDILHLKKSYIDEPYVLKRIKDQDLSNEIYAFIERNKNLIKKKNITYEERDILKGKIKRLKLWQKIGMSSGEYISLLKKKQKNKWEKNISEQDKKKIIANNTADIKKLELIKGKWLFNGKDTYVFTNTFVYKTLGIKLYRLKLINRPKYKDYDMSYAILINKKDNKSYLHLVYWQYEFQRASVIEFKTKDKFITLFNDEVDSEAVRIN